MDLSAGVGVRVRPAESSRLDRAAGEDWLAVGDAASAWDPLSSQGVYRALVTGLEASCTSTTCCGAISRRWTRMRIASQPITQPTWR